jgi:hypothetical protein
MRRYASAFNSSCQSAWCPSSCSSPCTPQVGAWPGVASHSRPLHLLARSSQYIPSQHRAGDVLSRAAHPSWPPREYQSLRTGYFWLESQCGNFEVAGCLIGLGLFVMCFASLACPCDVAMLVSLAESKSKKPALSLSACKRMFPIKSRFSMLPPSPSPSPVSHRHRARTLQPKLSLT